MNLNTNCDVWRQGSLPIWNYTSIILQLNKTYCTCTKLGEDIKHLGNICTNFDHLLHPLPDFMPLSLRNNNKKLYEAGSLFNTELQKQSKEELYEKKLLEYKQPQTYSSKPQAQEEERKGALIDEKVVTPRRRRSSRFNIRTRLMRIRKSILTNLLSSFKSSPKSTRGSPGSRNGRGSIYIGVSKNNLNWQTLINVRGSKKYIGTFANEVEAAKTYDIYAVAMKGDKASLNFSYSTQEMLSAIDHFIEHRSVNMDS
ncbi:unnamed protein product [Moneuplotes crassus]|uniref:AP2/ERF domain-containing protein n=1 Tax=Euplotes crassus TaxID=5936 RepID=A0AAD1Y3Y8_EUPCR|nr:unnamed protein product [Moneuplotes crassus]